MFGNQNDVVQIQSDQEPAIVNVQEEIRPLRKGRTICTNSSVAESGSNGRAENAVKRVQGKFRALRFDLEEELGAKININKPSGSWLIRWAGEVLTNYTRGDDGKTAWGRRRGKPCDKPIAKIGQEVIFLPLKLQALMPTREKPTWVKAFGWALTRGPRRY